MESASFSSMLMTPYSQEQRKQSNTFKVKLGNISSASLTYLRTSSALIYPPRRLTTFTEKMMASHEVPLWKYTINTPGRTDVKIIRGVHSEPNETYRSKVGSINWLVMALRYDLSYTAKELSRVLTEPTTEANNFRTMLTIY
jgi:hypothetical protein